MQWLFTFIFLAFSKVTYMFILLTSEVFAGTYTKDSFRFRRKGGIVYFQELSEQVAWDVEYQFLEFDVGNLCPGGGYGKGAQHTSCFNGVQWNNASSACAYTQVEMGSVVWAWFVYGVFGGK